MMFEVRVNDEVVFTNGSFELVETKGNLILFDTSVFNFSSLRNVANGGDKISVYRNNKCIFNGSILRHETHMERTGIFRYDYYCVDLYHEMQNLLLEHNIKEFKTVSEWLSFFIEEFNKQGKHLKLGGTIKNNLNVEIEIKTNITFASLLNEIKS